MRRKVLTNLKTILSYAQGQGLVAHNVARGIKLKADVRNAAELLREGRDFPSRAELKMLLDKAPPRWRAFIVTAVFTGMRASELRGLRWTDVDFDRGVIQVRQRADAWGNLGAPKSAAGKRDIPLTPLALNTLRTRRQLVRRASSGWYSQTEPVGSRAMPTCATAFSSRCKSRPWW